MGNLAQATGLPDPSRDREGAVGPLADARGSVTLFMCTNSARAGVAPTSGLRPRPAPVPVEWPFSAHEVMVPCTGKLQPEHLLKAFEAGADLVCVIACDAGNCHYLEGSRRAERRVAHVRQLLDDIGLGGERLLMFQLPGSAKEDMAMGCQPTTHGPDARATEEVAGRLKAIADEIAGSLKTLGLSPLRQKGEPARATAS
ncbi:MAG: hydrogenase iron-sulfur subunit [Planctomycetota bacterium]|nr:hydrogenase iron-sulfur subunit [Planctomycetota bacterium]